MIPRFKKFRGLKYADVVDRFQDAQPITQYSEGIESRACLQNSYFTQALSKIETTFQPLINNLQVTFCKMNTIFTVNMNEMKYFL